MNIGEKREHYRLQVNGFTEASDRDLKELYRVIDGMTFCVGDKIEIHRVTTERIR